MDEIKKVALDGKVGLRLNLSEDEADALRARLAAGEPLLIRSKDEELVPSERHFVDVQPSGRLTRHYEYKGEQCSSSNVEYRASCVCGWTEKFGELGASWPGREPDDSTWQKRAWDRARRHIENS